jgi:hypothetical protein
MGAGGFRLPGLRALQLLLATCSCVRALFLSKEKREECTCVFVVRVCFVHSGTVSDCRLYVRSGKLQISRSSRKL